MKKINVLKIVSLGLVWLWLSGTQIVFAQCGPTGTFAIPDPGNQSVVTPGSSYCTDISFDPSVTGTPNGISMNLTHTFPGDLSIRVTACGNTLMVLTRPGAAAGSCAGGAPFGTGIDIGGNYSFIDGGSNPDVALLLPGGGTTGLSSDPCGVGTVSSFADLFAACPPGVVTASVCVADHAGSDVGTVSNICFVIPPCDISVAVGPQGACDDDEYTQDLIVTFSNAPATGTLDINGQSFAIGTSPQTVTLTNLPADGNPVNVIATFSDNPDCVYQPTFPLWTAPEPCFLPCDLSVTIGQQGPCDDDEYTQDLTVFFTNPPATGTLDINGESFVIGTSPQSVTLTNLPADGQPVNLVASFSDDPNCVYAPTDAQWTAPPPCFQICEISVSVGPQGPCDDDEYTQELTVTFNNPPGSGTLVVNGQNFAIGTSPQTIILTGLPADGQPVNIFAFFSADDNCFYQPTFPGWTAPGPCFFPCQVTMDLNAPTEACSDAPIDWEPGSDCFIPGMSTGFPNGTGQVVDIFIYENAGNFNAPVDYEIDIPQPTNFGELEIFNPELTRLGGDFNCANPPSVSFTNETCNPILVTYFLVVFDYNSDFDDNGTGEYNPQCTYRRYDVTIYPAPLQVVEFGNLSCNAEVQLQAEDNTVCFSQTFAGCGVMTYDFSSSVTWTPPAGCPLPDMAGDITLDIFPPDITICPEDVTIQCGVIPAPNTANVGFIDNCPGAVVTWQGDVSSTGTCPTIVTRTYRVTDLCNLTDECIQTFRIDDTVLPTIDCPDNTSVSCDASTDPQATGVATGSDNCTVPVAISVSDQETPGNCPQERRILRTWTATDLCGNSTQCLQLIDVVDEGDPVAICPGDQTVVCAGDVPVPDPGLVGTTDNCGVAVVTHLSDVTINQVCVNRFSVVRTYIAEDVCGNTSTCSQTIHVFDGVAPILQDLPDLTINCEDPYPDDLPVTADNCGELVTLTATFEETVLPDCPSSHVAVRTFTATDVCGNTSVTTQSIWALDTQGPVFTYVPPDLTFECGEDNFIPAPVAEDNCWVCVIIYEDVVYPGNCPGESVTVRTYEASDQCGHYAYATHTITRVDHQAPEISLGPKFKEGDTLTLGCSQMLMFNADLTDACDDDVSLSWDVTGTYTGDCDVDGYIVIEQYTLTATDECGNNEDYVVHVRWIDDQAPYFHEYPEDLVVNCGGGLDTGEIEAWLNANGFGVAEDLCNEFTWSHDLDINALNCNNNNTVEVTFTVTDACGNAATATVELTLLATPMAAMHCTHPEAYYGNDDAATDAYISSLMGDGTTPLVFGVPGRSIVLTLQAAQCINGLLTSAGSVPFLPAGDIITAADCGVGNIQLTNDGRIKNKLLGQAITLALNIRAEAVLGSLSLAQSCVPVDPYIYSRLGTQATVADLLVFANQALGRAVPMNKSKRWIVHDQMKAINEYYADCASGCGNQNLQQVLPVEALPTDATVLKPDLKSLPADELVLEAFPNPAKSEIQVRILSGLSGDCQVMILHESGAVLQSGVMSAEVGILRFDCRSWASGLYMIRVNTAEGYGAVACVVVR